jgi:O-antigen/teichoic acid export membrane protein
LLLGAQVLVALAGLVSIRAFTFLAPPSVLGTANLLVGYLTLGTQIFLGGTTATVLRYQAEAATRGAADGFIGEARHWCLLGGMALCVVWLLTWVVLHGFQPGLLDLVGAAAGLAWIGTITVRNLLIARIQAEQHQGLYAAAVATEAVLLLSFTAAALHLHASAEAFILGQASGTGLLVLLLLACSGSARHTMRTKAIRGSGFGIVARRYGLPFAPLSALGWLVNSADRYVLAAVMTTDAVGRYVAPFSIASRGLIVTATAMTDLFRPLLFKAASETGTDRAVGILRRWLLTSVIVNLVALVAIHVLGGFVVELLLAPAYRGGAVAIMLWVSAGYAAYGINQILETRLLSLGHSARLLLPMALGGLSNVALSILLIRTQGIVGAAQATCASFAIQCVVTALFLHRVTRARA